MEYNAQGHANRDSAREAQIPVPAWPKSALSGNQSRLLMQCLLKTKT
jgi:hypothetical protein